MISSVTRFGAVALLAGVLLSSVVPAGAAHLACKQHATFGLGRGPDLDTAMNNAIQNWRVRTAAAFGAAYVSRPSRTIDTGSMMPRSVRIVVVRSIPAFSSVVVMVDLA